MLEKLTKMTRTAFFGFLGGTAIIHITPIAGRIIRDFETKYLEEKHHEYETAVLLFVGFITMIIEPVFYLVNLALSLENHGPISFFWLTPVCISQLYACIKWIARIRTSP